jgi:hypothetical protein
MSIIVFVFNLCDIPVLVSFFIGYGSFHQIYEGGEDGTKIVLMFLQQ